MTRLRPKSGDLVRATRDVRDWEPVEGILHVEYVPALDYARATVYSADEGSCVVDPSSVEVITPSVIDPAEMDVGLPTTADPGWEPLLYLDDAVARGLVQTRERIGGTWAEMEQAVESLGALLVAAGWRFDGVNREMSFAGGESVVGMFSRGSLSAELEYYEEGTLCVYEPSDSAPPDEDDPAVTWVGDPDQAAMRDLFTRLGMLAPPAASEEAAHGGVQPC